MDKRLYQIWADMRRRCNAKSTRCYQRYGGRGIKVCPEWDSYGKFEEWAFANGYSDDLTIDRIDNDKGYSPDNCRWASRKTQARNRSDNVVVDGVVGVRVVLADVIDSSPLNPNTIRSRIRRGRSVQDALASVKPRTYELTFNGVTKKMFEWAKDIGISSKLIQARLKRGWSIERTLTEAKHD